MSQTRVVPVQLTHIRTHTRTHTHFIVRVSFSLIACQMCQLSKFWILSYAELWSGIYLKFLFLVGEMAHGVKIIPSGEQWPVCPAYSIPWLLIDICVHESSSLNELIVTKLSDEWRSTKVQQVGLLATMYSAGDEQWNGANYTSPNCTSWMFTIIWMKKFSTCSSSFMAWSVSSRPR